MGLGVVLTTATLLVGSVAGEMPDCATGGIIELELARTEAKAERLIGACDDGGLDVLRDALRVDTLAFVPLYVAAAAWWTVLGVRRLPWSSPLRRRLVAAAVPAIVAAAGLDLVENHHLATVIDAGGSSGAAGAAFTASVGKWLLVLYAMPASAVAMVRCARAA